MKPAALCFLALALFTSCQAARAQNVGTPREVTGTLTERQRASLAGLAERGPLYVAVAPFAPDAEAAGLHQGTILSDVTAMLKRTGIRAATSAPRDVSSYQNAPRLTIQTDVQKVGGASSKGNAYTVFLTVNLIQPVLIERAGKATPSRRISLPTWQSITYTVLVRESLPTVRARIGQAVGAFIADYKAANK